MGSHLPRLDPKFVYFKVPLDGSIKIQDLQDALRDQLKIETDDLAELPDVKSDLREGRKFSRHLRILAALTNDERLDYSTEISGAGENVHRLMGVLRFDQHYPEGFMLEVYGTDISDTMMKKINRIQKLFGGLGAPPFEPPRSHDVDPQFVATNIKPK